MEICLCTSRRSLCNRSVYRILISVLLFCRARAEHAQQRELQPHQPAPSLLFPQIGLNANHLKISGSVHGHEIMKFISNYIEFEAESCSVLEVTVCCFV